MNINDIMITSLETITAFDVATGAYKFTLDELQNANIANSQDTSEITGKQGRLLSQLKRNKSVVVSGTNGMVSGGLLETQTGGTFENKTTEVLWTDYMTVSDNQATGAYTAVGTVGAEIEALYVKNADGTLGAMLTQNATATEGKFKYTPGTKKFEFANIPDNSEVIAYYKRKITADVLENDSDSYSGKAALYIDALAEDKCANVYRVQFFVPKADFSGEFSIELGDNQTVHEFEAKSLSGACGNGSRLWSYTIFGVNTEDTP